MLHVVSSSVIELLETIASTTCRGSGVSFDWASIMCRTVTRNDPSNGSVADRRHRSPATVRPTCVPGCGCMWESSRQVRP
jgi:hypothetical protein